ncbi:MAG: inositol monophosphatase family protein [Dehalococcoidia bacterium]|nr:inositol monophosphatase family protein [Dehalococcoidia bacterium]
MKPTHLPTSRSGLDPLSVATQAARDAGDILKSYFSNKKEIQSKGNRNLVTNADLLAEKSVLARLKDEYPEHSILCEESGKSDKSSPYCWIIDPLDGTTNYAFGIPLFAVSIALAYRDVPVVGVVYDPLRNEMFRAEKGKGAFLNDSAISVKREQDLKMKIIGLDLGYDDAKTKELLSKVLSLWSADTTFRITGSSALGLTYVACGRLSVYFHRSLYPWDMAAAMLLIREAGGIATDWQGNPSSVWDGHIFACGDINAHRGVRDILAQSGQG